MFTGIIEAIGKITALKKEDTNLRISISSPFTSELKIDQSIAHNGICLTVVNISDDVYDVVAIDETLRRTNLGLQKVGSKINLERCMKIGDRLDGHMVQGHVDTTATVLSVAEQGGSWIYSFEYPALAGHITVEKGSICVNGVSLTVVDSIKNTFSVAIIPFTREHTNFSELQKGDKVNIEFDVIGKYVARIMSEKN
ncbi:MAG: riboflavin synthase [Bacteroidetes bacterium]|nr:MAG: riboflavin synthase [Bacteroidota bacterium]